MHFPSTKIRQGKIEKVELSFSQDLAQKIEMQKMKGQKLGDTFYLYSLGPIMRKSGDENLSSTAKMIVIAEPKGSELLAKINDQEVLLKWNQLDFEKVETPKDFLTAEFSIPGRTNFLLFGVIFSVLLLSAWGVFYLRRRSLLKNKQKNERDRLIALVLNATNYDEIVDVWKNKLTVTKVFPGMDEVYKDLELVLFKYQFKSEQSASEKAEVSSAYKEFCLKAKGVMDGI